MPQYLGLKKRDIVNWLSFSLLTHLAGSRKTVSLQPSEALMRMQRKITITLAVRKGAFT